MNRQTSAYTLTVQPAPGADLSLELDTASGLVDAVIFSRSFNRETGTVSVTVRAAGDPDALHQFGAAITAYAGRPMTVHTGYGIHRRIVHAEQIPA